MIIKERDAAEHRDNDELSRTGARAELQMAHYLRRSFGGSVDTLVLNDIRLEIEEDIKEAIQIDHIVIHKHGLIIIESKSVIGRIAVNERGEWMRIWSGGSRGMPSPVLQAKRQAEMLHKVLRAECDNLLGKMLFGRLQKGFGKCPIEILIAISDEGIIDRKKDIPELYKADQIPEQVQAILERHRKAARIVGGNLSLTNSDGVMDFSEQERRNIATFLVEHHYPLPGNKAQPPPVVESVQASPTPSVAPSCPRCGKPLVQRVARKGKNPGARFWGCSGFPACRYASAD